ncbi:hypothetical protein PanWU01x14_032050 [Parasponia andersonii]|uniref:Uncharacterized protein n=1 Tax=Parasponia andersonii TaxID=3476 RepID=A0A2P5DUC2_PARAD|nr:hypothetical protein PanWU01x14_032050 [Parasponia andersonii]
MDEVQPWTKLEADAIRFLLCHRRSLKLDSSYSSSSIDELWQLTSSTQSITGSLKISFSFSLFLHLHQFYSFTQKNFKKISRV